ncbi:type VI secretion protein IcmF/TssM N-terminal domain-containing protein, partial [candidate division CSSED10-310 bacterium]
NCDWWFFNDAIVLDTAGRYSIPVDEENDREEWQEFLTLLSKYRRKEPLNGVIVTVAADKLTMANAAKLKEDGQYIRKRIDHLMHIIGAKFPVYVLITKMDLIHGFVDFFNQIPRDRVSQAMGFINNKRFAAWQEVVTEAHEKMADTLRELRLFLVHEDVVGEPGALLFPAEFDKIFEPLNAFMNDICEENPYQETPYLRGLFFSSSTRKGVPESELLQLLDLVQTVDESSLEEEEFFLKDFFAKILPRDRRLFQPLRELILWKRLTSRLGTLSILLVALAIFGVISFSFYQNIKTITGFTSEFYHPPLLTQKTTTDILILERFRSELLELAELNKSWVTRHLTFNHSLRVEQLMKQHYILLIQGRFLKRFDDEITSGLTAEDTPNPEQEMSAAVDYYLYRNYLLKHYAESGGQGSPEKFNDVCTRMVMSRDPELSEEMASKFIDVYRTYLDYEYPDQNTEAEQHAVDVKIFDILNKQEEGLRWLVRNWTLSKWNADAPDVKITDFCGDLEVSTSRDIIAVSGAYTLAGRDLIATFKKSVEQALPDNGPLDKEFWPWYYQRYFKQWSLFAQYMGGWLKGLDKSTDWEYMATLMTTDHNPYVQLITKMASEFRTIHDNVTQPDWVKFILHLDDIRKLAEVEKQKEEGSFTAKITGTKESLLKKTLETVDVAKAKEMEQKLIQAKAWYEYLLSLEKLETHLFSEETCFKLASGYFTPESGSENSMDDLYAVHVKYTKFKHLMTDKDATVGLGLAIGPLDFIVSYTAERTTCVLQELWQKEVLSEVRGVDSAQVPKILFDEIEGVVWKFVTGAAKPFIDKGLKGYFSRRVRNAEILFTNEFFHYLNLAKEGVISYKLDYMVTIEALPIEVNKDSSLEPFASIIQVACAKEKQYLENYNYPISRAFHWSPEACGKTSLTIWFPEVTLSKEYTGNLSFAKFLLEFRDGKKTFKPEDFPEMNELLVQKNITEITLSYEITGGEEVIKLLNRVPENLLPKIAQCWLK